MGACYGKHSYPARRRAERDVFYYPATAPAMERKMDIPRDIVEEILLNLPVKSLLRFCRVSKSWQSMIRDGEFVKRYRLRASLPGRETIVLGVRYDDHSCSDYLSSCDVSSMPTHNPADIARPLVRPFKAVLWRYESYERLLASCNELWCLQQEETLILWNPSIRTHRKLPAPLLPVIDRDSAFGLGYDSVGDDYKLLKIHSASAATELYSLSNDSWREMPPFPTTNMIDFSAARFVGGALYWMAMGTSSSVIVSFDLSSEKYGEIALPEYHLTKIKPCLSVWKGRLSVYSDYEYPSTSLVVWVMEDDAWSKELDIVDEQVVSPGIHRFDDGEEFYFYDNRLTLIRAFLLRCSRLARIVFIQEGKDWNRKVVKKYGGAVYHHNFSQLRYSYLCSKPCVALDQVNYIRNSINSILFS